MTYLVAKQVLKTGKLEIHKYMEIKQYTPKQPMGQKKSKRQQKVP